MSGVQQAFSYADIAETSSQNRTTYCYKAKH